MWQKWGANTLDYDPIFPYLGAFSLLAQRSLNVVIAQHASIVRSRRTREYAAASSQVRLRSAVILL